MNRLKFLMVLFAALCISTIVYADSDGEKDPQSSNVGLFYNKKGSQRPNAPSRNMLMCYYGAGYMNFIIPEGVEYMTVDIQDCDEVSVWQGFVTSEEPNTEIPELSGEYTVVCTTDGNSTYSGKIIL